MVNISATQTWEIAGTAAAFLAFYLADCYTTMIGLSKGWVEANPLNRWLFKKISFSLTCWLEGVIVLIAGAAIFNYGAKFSMLFYGAIAAGEAVISLRNYLKLKKAGISLK